MILKKGELLLDELLKSVFHLVCPIGFREMVTKR
jgi:hypothetical protein